MKTLAPAFLDQTDARRVRKPEMEKRRRDRINHSLESLRRLLLENTRNEKFKNPKVEKADILESVVDFLRTQQEGDHQPMKRRFSSARGEESPSCKGRLSYQEGMRSCLLRVSHFIATKSQEMEDTIDTPLQTSMGFSRLTHHPTHLQFHLASTTTSSPVPMSEKLLNSFCPSANPLPSAKCPTTTTLSPPLTPYMELSDSVWRPWP